MPAALDVNWEAVRAHAIIHGVRPTALHYGISPGTLTARSHREGWFDHVREARAVTVPATMQTHAVDAVKPVQAAQNALMDYSGRSKLGLAKAVTKTSEKFGRMPAKQLIHMTQEMKNAAGTAKLTFDWGQSDTPSFIVNISSLPPAQAQVPDISMLRECSADPAEELRSSAPRPEQEQDQP